jgi:type IX secretion system PorP/SprF family membrane protein
MKKLVIAILLALAPTLTLFSQDPVFTQAYSAGMYLNPALTGEQKGYKASVNYRNQWPSISGNYVTTVIGIQKSFAKNHLGVGLNILGDAAGSGTLNTTGIGLLFSERFGLLNKIEGAWGINASFYQKTVDVSGLTFGNNIDPKLGFTNSSPNDPNFNSTISYFNISCGIIVKYAFGNTGVVYNNINTPNKSFYSGSTSRLPARLTIHNTYYILSKSPVWKLSHTIVYNHQADFNAIITYFTAQYKWLKWCAGYYSSNALIGGLGIAFPRFNINYTYEYTISKLTNATGGSHEIGMSFRFGNKKEYGDKGCLSF